MKKAIVALVMATTQLVLEIIEYRKKNKGRK